MANPIQLEQVFINLLTNARDAVTDRAERTISLSSRTDGVDVEVVTRDTGPGIAPGMEKRIFDPFFTTKEVGAGTGLGLSITYGILQEHGGSIEGYSSPGKGAAFCVRLPLAAPEGGDSIL